MMTVTEEETKKYIRMIDEMQAAKSFAAAGDINNAMISAEKSTVLYRFLEQNGIIDGLAKGFETEKVPEEFKKIIAAEAYLAASENALKEGNVKKAQISHWMIMPGTELRQYLLDTQDLEKRAKKMDNLLCIVNRKYFN